MKRNLLHILAPRVGVCMLLCVAALSAATEETPATRPAASAGPYDFAKERQEWWSFQPVKDPAAPQVTESAWANASPIDRLIASNYESRHLHPVAPADKRTLIRRATFDLTGLPPTPEEVEQFLSDDAPDAFEKVVDRLL